MTKVFFILHKINYHTTSYFQVLFKDPHSHLLRKHYSQSSLSDCSATLEQKSSLWLQFGPKTFFGGFSSDRY